MNENIFLKRPTSDETDDDIMEMQRQWELRKNKGSSVKVQRMNRNSVKKASPALPKTSRTGAFTLDLDDIREETDVQQVLFGIQEKNVELLEGGGHDTLLKESFSSNYSKEDGFPEPLDLSAYYDDNHPEKRKAIEGRSYFAAEFDRINGKLEENLDEAVQDDIVEVSKEDDFEKENEKYLKSLDFEKIKELKSEIEERLDPKLIEFLMSRQKKMSPEKKEPKKVSKFKKSRMAGNTFIKPEDNKNIEKEKEESIVNDMIKELEVVDEFSNQQDQEKYNRLATNAAQLDMAAKFGRNLAQRQQKNALKLFDICNFPPSGYDKSDDLRELARSNIEEIKNLYLEDVKYGEEIVREFGKGLNPIVDTCWTLVPARRVLDAVEKRQGTVTSDDVEIVRLALLWTYLMFMERTTAFYAFTNPEDVYVFLSEIFLIGSEVLEDKTILNCIDKVMNRYILKAASENRLTLRMSAKIGGLDAFMPLYENLLKNYEQYSVGDVTFTRTILICAYLNQSISDSLQYRFSIWSPKKNVARQMTISIKEGKDILDIFKKQYNDVEKIIDEQHYMQYTSLLGAYVAAIRDDMITRERNGLLFEIASFELGMFMERRKHFLKGPEKQKELDILVEIIRKSVGNKLLL